MPFLLPGSFHMHIYKQFQKKLNNQTNISNSFQFKNSYLPLHRFYPKTQCAQISARQQLVDFCRFQPFFFCRPHLMSVINICLPFTADLVGTFGRRLYPSIKSSGTATSRSDRQAKIEKLYFVIISKKKFFCHLKLTNNIGGCS